MKRQRFPPGWNQEGVQRLIAHYDSLTEEEIAAEDNAVLASQDEWDRQLEADYVAGRLDWLIAEAHRDLNEGRRTDR
jgi:hypothetical protein